MIFFKIEKYNERHARTIHHFVMHTSTVQPQKPDHCSSTWIWMIRWNGKERRSVLARETEFLKDAWNRRFGFLCHIRKLYDIKTPGQSTIVLDESWFPSWNFQRTPLSHHDCSRRGYQSTSTMDTERVG